MRKLHRPGGIEPVVALGADDHLSTAHEVEPLERRGGDHPHGDGVRGSRR
jgi:hypothetical protein